MSDFPHRVVYVEDEPDIRRIVREALEQASQDIILVTCGTGQELISRIRELQPDLILLDLKMKGLSGPDVLDQLRKMPEGTAVPVIFITGTKVEMTDAYKSLGVIGVIHKPFEMAQVASDIAALWQKHLAAKGEEALAVAANRVAN